MKEIFEQYGGVLITITAIVAVIAVVIAVVGTGEQGTIGKAFSELVTDFMDQARTNANF